MVWGEYSHAKPRPLWGGNPDPLIHHPEIREFGLRANLPVLAPFRPSLLLAEKRHTFTRTHAHAMHTPRTHTLSVTYPVSLRKTCCLCFQHATQQLHSRNFLKAAGEFTGLPNRLRKTCWEELPWKGFVNQDKEGTLALPCFMRKGTHTTKPDYKNLILQAPGKRRRPGEVLPLLNSCVMRFLSEDPGSTPRAGLGKTRRVCVRGI